MIKIINISLGHCIQFDYFPELSLMIMDKINFHPASESGSQLEILMKIKYLIFHNLHKPSLIWLHLDGTKLRKVVPLYCSCFPLSSLNLPPSLFVKQSPTQFLRSSSPLLHESRLFNHPLPSPSCSLNIQIVLLVKLKVTTIYAYLIQLFLGIPISLHLNFHPSLLAFLRTEWRSTRWRYTFWRCTGILIVLDL